MLTDRQECILKEIIEHYINTAEAIGSRTLSKCESVTCSPATIRNEMADLEEMGYIEKTHTSSGRVPSEKGYRYYVEKILSDGSNENYDFIDKIFDKDLIREDAINEAIEVISQLTNYAAVALGPDAHDSLIRKVDCIPLSDDIVVVMIVSDTGHIENKKIKLPADVSIEEMKKTVDHINEILTDTPISRIAEKLSAIDKSMIKDYMDYYDEILEAFIEAFSYFTSNNVTLSGTNNMLTLPEFHDIEKLRNIMGLLDSKKIMKIVDSNQSGLSIKIGDENNVEAMKDCTMISVSYDTGSNQKGQIAVVGPTRMDYKKVIPMLEYMAKIMSDKNNRR